jgi:hypothetical protein
MCIAKVKMKIYYKGVCRERYMSMGGGRVLRITEANSICHEHGKGKRDVYKRCGGRGIYEHVIGR